MILHGFQVLLPENRKNDLTVEDLICRDIEEIIEVKTALNSIRFKKQDIIPAAVLKSHQDRLLNRSFRGQPQYPENPFLEKAIKAFYPGQYLFNPGFFPSRNDHLIILVEWFPDLQQGMYAKLQFFRIISWRDDNRQWKAILSTFLRFPGSA